MLIQHARHGSSALSVRLPALPNAFHVEGWQRPAYTGIKFDGDGHIYSYQSNGTWSKNITWLQAGAAGSFFLFRKLDSGALYADAHDAIGTISGISKAATAVVDAVAHGMVDGDSVRIENVVGMTEVNGNIYEVDNAGADDFELKSTNSSGYGAWVSGGVAYVERMAMGTDREYLIENDIYGDITSARITFEIFNAVATGSPLQSRAYRFSILLEEIDDLERNPNWARP